MINIGVSKLGLNTATFYHKLFQRIDLDEEVAVTYVTEDKLPYNFILFDGGADVSPIFYNAKKALATSCYEYRDEYEIKIYNDYKDTPTKFAGICRGLQLLNILRGGNLYQDLYMEGLGHTHAHEIRIDNACSITPKEMMVNSLHHQAINKLGDNLFPLGWEVNTGIIEIIGERDDKIRAVQFHPEFVSAFSSAKDFLKWLIRKE